ncbi:unnamed protein product [Arctogadus glacialis]
MVNGRSQRVSEQTDQMTAGLRSPPHQPSDRVAPSGSHPAVLGGRWVLGEEEGEGNDMPHKGLIGGEEKSVRSYY